MCNCKEWVYCEHRARGESPHKGWRGERRLLNGPTRQKHFQDKE